MVFDKIGAESLRSLAEIPFRPMALFSVRLNIESITII